jgi:hypothetical protein
LSNFLHIPVIGVPSGLPIRSAPAGPGTLAAALPARWVLPLVASLLVALPVFLQAPWVRQSPVAAALFTIPLVTLGLLLERRGSGRSRQLGVLLVGFSGSWLGGSLFWGWFRLHPVLHLPVEAFALPLALAGLAGRWRIAAAFYLSSLLGTAATDAVMAATGVMELWPRVLQAPLTEAPLLLREATLDLAQPLPLLILLGSGTLLIGLSRRLWRQGSLGRIAAATLATTLVVDGLFVAAAALAPSLSGLL